MLLLGLGAGIAFNPLLLAAMSDVDESESGLASGIVNTSFMMGGALGLAVLASLAALYTGTASASGASEIAALNDGYRLAFGVGAVCALVAAGTRRDVAADAVGATRDAGRQQRLSAPIRRRDRGDGVVSAAFALSPS